MNRRERTTCEPNSEAGTEMYQEERVRSLYVAAYPPAYPSAEPSEALAQRVADLAARHNARAVRPPRQWLRPLHWRYAAGATAAVIALLALALFARSYRSIGNAGLTAAGIPPAPQSTPGPRSPWLAPGRDQAPRSVKHPPFPARGGGLSQPPAFTPSTAGQMEIAGGQRPVGPAQAHPMALPSANPSLDDMAYLNSDAKEVTRPWASLPPDEWERMEARVRSQVKVRDDFVSIPFPRLAGVSTRSIAGAVESYKRKAAIVDPRLTREVTLACKGTAFSDLCDQLRSDTGIELTAGPSAADEKVTLFCEKRPLRDIMREINRTFGFTWLRSGQPGAFRYELEQDLRSQLLEEELRNRDRDAALLALDAEMQKSRPYVALSLDELRRRWEQVPEAERHNIGSRGDDGSGKWQLWLLAVAGAWGGAQIYHRVTPRDRAALMAGEELVFRTDAPDPERRIPAAFGRQLLLSVPAAAFGSEPGYEFDELRLGVHRTELGEVTLKVGIWAAQGHPRQGEGPRFGIVQQVATAHSPSAANPGNGAANKVLRGRAPFERVVSVQPKVSCPVAKEGPYDKYLVTTDSITVEFDGSQPHATSADAWEAVHRATGLPIIADFYTHLYPVRRLSVDRQPLFDALCKVGDAMDVRWRKDGDFLVGRSARFFWDRLQEVPNRYLQRWARDRDANGGLPLTDFLEMAGMTDPQLDAGTVAQGIERVWGLREWGWARSRTGRLDARCLALLTPEQLRRAQEPAGLAFRELSPIQQQAVVRLEHQREDEFGGGEAPPTVMRTPETFAHGSIVACYVAAGWYVAQMPRILPLGAPDDPTWSGPWNYVGGRTEAEAIAAARQRYPQLIPRKVSRVPDGYFSINGGVMD